MSQPAPIVSSVLEEEAFIGNCTQCGQPWSWTHNEVFPDGTRWYDHVAYACPACAHTQLFTFDVTAFFVPRARVWSMRRRPMAGVIIIEPNRAAALNDLYSATAA